MWFTTNVKNEALPEPADAPPTLTGAGAEAAGLGS